MSQILHDICKLKKIFFAYLKFKFNWTPCTLSGSLTSTHTCFYPLLFRSTLYIFLQVLKSTDDITPLYHPFLLWIFQTKEVTDDFKIWALPYNIQDYHSTLLQRHFGTSLFTTEFLLLADLRAPCFPVAISCQHKPTFRVSF